MLYKNDNDLFYLCSLIDYIGRETKNTRDKIVKLLGDETINHIYSYADVYHCDPIAAVAQELIEEKSIETGTFDNVSQAKYETPSYWDIGSVYTRLIEDIAAGKTVVEGVHMIYDSWINPILSDYNNPTYFQSREYIAECYREGEIL